MSYYFVLWDINIFRKQSNASSLEETKDPYLIFQLQEGSFSMILGW